MKEAEMDFQMQQVIMNHKDDEDLIRLKSPFKPALVGSNNDREDIISELISKKDTDQSGIENLVKSQNEVALKQIFVSKNPDCRSERKISSDKSLFSQTSKSDKEDDLIQSNTTDNKNNIRVSKIRITDDEPSEMLDMIICKVKTDKKSK